MLQIRAEAKLEEEREKQQHQLTKYSKFGGSGSGSGDAQVSRQNLSTLDELLGRSKEVERSREKFDHTKVVGILSKRKQKGSVLVGSTTYMNI